MRVITQKNNISYPFDKLVVWVEAKTVFCEVVGNTRNIKEILGRYNTHERAVEVFNELDEHYTNLTYMEDGATLYNLNSYIMPEE